MSCTERELYFRNIQRLGIQDLSDALKAGITRLRCYMLSGSIAENFDVGIKNQVATGPAYMTKRSGRWEN